VIFKICFDGTKNWYSGDFWGRKIVCTYLKIGKYIRDGVAGRHLIRDRVAGRHLIRDGVAKRHLIRDGVTGRHLEANDRCPILV